MLCQAPSQGSLRVAVGKKEPQRAPGNELDRLSIDGQLERLGKHEIGDDPQQLVNFLDAKSQLPRRRRHSQANEKRQQPVACFSVVVLWQHRLYATSIIVARREVGAEQQRIALPQ